MRCRTMARSRSVWRRPWAPDLNSHLHTFMSGPVERAATLMLLHRLPVRRCRLPPRAVPAYNLHAGIVGCGIRRYQRGTCGVWGCQGRRKIHAAARTQTDAGAVVATGGASRCRFVWNLPMTNDARVDATLRLGDLVLNADRTSVRFHLPPLPIEGQPEPLHVHLDFDAAMVLELIEQLKTLYAEMEPCSPSASPLH